MQKIRLWAACASLSALLVLGLSVMASPTSAGTLDYDAGLRASIYDENYKLGVGGELGAVAGLNPNWAVGLHLNYTHFAAKTESWTAAEEYGAYVTAYFLPQIDQAFSLRIGPHIGYAYIRNSYADVGGDLMAVFQVMPRTRFYAAFVPSFMIGPTPQSLFRFGLGVEYRPGG